METISAKPAHKKSLNRDRLRNINEYRQNRTVIITTHAMPKETTEEWINR